MKPANRRDHPHFLLATDLSPSSEPHIPLGIRIADELGARTTLFHVVVPPTLVVDPSATAVVLQPDKAIDGARSHLRAIAKAAGTARPVHVAVTTEIDARAAILAAASEMEADMIVLPTHGRSGWKRVLLGSVAEQVLRRAHCPVLLLTERMLARAKGGAPRGPVVVATDLGVGAEAACRPAVDLAQRLGRRVTLVSVEPEREPPVHGPQPSVIPTDPRARTQDRLRALRSLGAILDGEIGIDAIVEVAAQPEVGIVRAAEALDAALLVLSTHGRRGLQRLVEGSVAEATVRTSTVPVVCLPMATVAEGK